MKTYDILTHPKKGIKAVKCGFSWPALILQFIWAFVHRLFGIGIFLIIFEIIAAKAMGIGYRNILVIFVLGIRITVGCFGNKMIKTNLLKKGYVISGTVKASSYKDAMDSTQNKEGMDEEPSVEKNLKVINGFLKLFVNMLIYLAPVIYVIGIIFSWFYWFIVRNNIMSGYEESMLGALINTIACIVLLVFGIKTGKALRDVRPNAVVNIRKYLKAVVIWELISLGIWVVIAETLVDSDPMGWWLIRATAIVKAHIVFVICLIWSYYFKKSKRVKATYGAEVKFVKVK